MDVNGIEIEKVYRKDKDNVYKENELRNMYIDLVNTGILDHMWSQLIKTEIVKEYIKNSDYSIAMSEDVEANIQILDKYKILVVIGDILYNYRYNPNSITKKIGLVAVKKRIEDLQKVYYHFSEFFKKNCEDLYNKSLEKSIYRINKYLITLSSVSNLKYNETVSYLESVMKQDFVQTLVKNTNYKNIKIDKSIEKIFLKNLYTNNYKLYAIELIILSKLKMIKRTLKKLKK
jgi:hypothetical protein